MFYRALKFTSTSKPLAKEVLQFLVPKLLGTAASLVDLMPCPIVWLPILCEDQAGMDGFS